MNEFDKDSGYKINTEESFVFLYIKNERLDKLRKQSSLTITSKRIKYLGINLPKETKDLYAEKSKTADGRS